MPLLCGKRWRTGINVASVSFPWRWWGKSRGKFPISLVFCPESHERIGVMKMSLPTAGQWNWMGFAVLPNPNHSRIPWFYIKNWGGAKALPPLLYLLVFQGPPNLTNFAVPTANNFFALNGASRESLEDAQSKLHFPDNLFQRLITSTARNNSSSC